jgi:hypothetical protein
VGFSCEDSNAKVAFAGVSLEDVTANPKAATPAEIRKKERDSEMLLLKGIQRQREQGTLGR